MNFQTEEFKTQINEEYVIETASKGTPMAKFSTEQRARDWMKSRPKGSPSMVLTHVIETRVSKVI